MVTNKMILGLADTQTTAEHLIGDLEQAGYNPKDISIAMKDHAAGETIANDTGASVADGVVGGAATGGIIGGIAGLLVGIGAIAIPGIGALLIGGPLAAALGLTGAAATTATGAVTGAVAGGLIGALVSLGIPEQDARFYNEHVNQGAILLAVPTIAGTEEKAREIMEADGATNVRVLAVNDQTTQPVSPMYTEPAMQPNVGYAGGAAYAPQPKRNVFRDDAPEAAAEKSATAPAWLDPVLADAVFPTNKHGLLRNAVQNGASDAALLAIESLPDNAEFSSADQVKASLKQ